MSAGVEDVEAEDTGAAAEVDEIATAPHDGRAAGGYVTTVAERLTVKPNAPHEHTTDCGPAAGNASASGLACVGTPRAVTLYGSRRMAGRLLGTFGEPSGADRGRWSPSGRDLDGLSEVSPQADSEFPEGGGRPHLKVRAEARFERLLDLSATLLRTDHLVDLGRHRIPGFLAKMFPEQCTNSHFRWHNVLLFLVDTVGLR